jgi:phosphate-selective porin OprO/OprP
MYKLRSANQWILLLLVLMLSTGLAIAAGDPQTGSTASPALSVAASVPPASQTPAAVATAADAGQAAAPAAVQPDDGQTPVPAAAPAAGQQTTDQKLQELQKRVDELAQKEKAGTTVTADLTGFTIKNNDFLLKIGADLQVDERMFSGPAQTVLPDGFLLRRIRPTFSGTVFKYVDYFFRPDFGQGSTVIYDAYVELKYFKSAKLRVGKFKPGVGLERLQSDDDTSFVERGLPTLLVPSRDIGYQLSGDLLSKHLSYSVGVFNGVPDNGLGDTAVSDHRDYTARLYVTPIDGEKSQLGFGMGASSGNVDGEALPSFKTFGQNAFFAFASGVTEDGHRTRLAPGLYYYLGPFGLLSEYGLTEEGLQKGTVRRDIAFRAWQVETSFILTGERKSFASPTPKRNFDPRNHGWGAVELALRVGGFAAEDGIYNYGFALATTTPREAHEWVGGINWYLNRLVRISCDYGYTTFGGGATIAAGINRPAEKALILRFQINFI